MVAVTGFPAIVDAFLDFFVPTNVVIMDNVLSEGRFWIMRGDSQRDSVRPEPVFALVSLLQTDVASG